MKVGVVLPNLLTVCTPCMFVFSIFSSISISYILSVIYQLYVAGSILYSQSERAAPSVVVGTCKELCFYQYIVSTP